MDMDLKQTKSTFLTPLMLATVMLGDASTLQQAMERPEFDTVRSPLYSINTQTHDSTIRSPQAVSFLVLSKY